MVFGKSPRHRSSVLRSTSYLRLPTSPTDLVRGHVLLHSSFSRRTEVDAFRTAWIAARRAAYAHVARANIVWFPPRSRPTNHHVDGSAFSPQPSFFFLFFFLKFFWDLFVHFQPLDGWDEGLEGGVLCWGGEDGKTRTMGNQQASFHPHPKNAIDGIACKKRDSRTH